MPVTSADGLALRVLERLVGIETPSGHVSGILDAFALLREELAPTLGTDGAITWCDGVPHLVWEASAEPRILLLGHVDTVWPLGALAARPFTVVDGRATGPGVFDMKAGLAIAVQALGLAADVTHVSVLVTGDEEAGSLTSRETIERLGARCRAVLVLEPSADGALKIARKGAGMYRLHVHGRAAHAGLEPERGVNALSELARLVPEVEALARESLGTTVTPTVARAGDATNTVPADAELAVDVRAWTAAELERVDAELRRIAPHHPHVSLRISGAVNRYAMEAAQSRDLLELARSVATRLGLGPLTEARVGGASDGNFTAALGVPTLDGLGATGGGAHAEDEWVEVASLTHRARLVAGLLDALRACP